MYKLLVEEPEGKRPLGRARHRWMYNINMDFVEIGWGRVDFIGLAQDRKVESSCECSKEPPGSIKSWESIQWLHNGGLLSSAQLHRVG
jgi:hypothetical protein